MVLGFVPLGKYVESYVAQDSKYIASIIYTFSLVSCISLCRLLELAVEGLSTTARKCLFLDHTSEVMLLALEPGLMRSKWRYFMDSLSDMHRSWADVDGHCFSTHTVHGSELLNFSFLACALNPNVVVEPLGKGACAAHSLSHWLRFLQLSAYRPAQ